jgi:hypothetical protein
MRPLHFGAWAALFVGFLVVVLLEASLLVPAPTPQSAAGWGVAAADHGRTTPAILPTPRDKDDEGQDELPDVTVQAVENRPPQFSITADEPPESAETLKPPPEEPVSARPVATMPAPLWSPEQLQESLLRVPEIWLQPPTIPTVPKTGRIVEGQHPLLAILDSRADLRGLQARRGRAAVLPQPEADAFRDTSVLLRKGLSELQRTDTRRNRRLQIHPEVLTARPQIVARVLHQMLQAEAEPLRKLMLSQLKQQRSPAASRALAHQALYEPLPALRQIALKALEGRPVNDFLPVLLDAFRNPWPPAADHAADTLITLGAADAVGPLIARLDDPSPSAPVDNQKGESVVHELVRVNHARNCLLCHAQSVSRGDGVRVAAPKPTRPLPPPFSLNTYEGGGRGGSSTPPDSVFVRPDITYLQQDFSWVLPVSNSNPWPTLQRYDFLVRTRPAVDADRLPGDPEYPQRKALVRALQALTGKDFGNRAAEWRAGLTMAK